MRSFFTTLVGFIYLILAFFIQPETVYANSNFLPNIPSQKYISEIKSEITLTHRIEDYYIVAQNHTNTEISNSSNKNYDLSLAFGDEVFNEDNILRFILFNKNTNHNTRIVHKISPKLKHAIYTRAP